VRTILDLPRLPDDPLAPFPDTADALDSPNGLLAWGGELQPERLLRAYRFGIFPWYSEGQPVLWWSPAPRCVLLPEAVYLAQRTRRRFNSGRYHLSLDQAFAQVIDACAAPRREGVGTWITRDMRNAYVELHRLGHAHSLEVWLDGDLVGGIYGLALGAAFFGESMFSVATDASKIALVALCRQLESWGFELLDCQVGNPHLFSMGAIEVPRESFEGWLAELVDQPGRPGLWRDDAIPRVRW